MSNLEKAVMLGVGTIIFGVWLQQTTKKCDNRNKIVFSKHNLDWRDEIANRIPVHKLLPSVN